MIVKWGKCRQDGDQPALSEVVRGLVPCIRWSLMSQDTLRAVGRAGLRTRWYRIY